MKHIKKLLLKIIQSNCRPLWIIWNYRKGRGSMFKKLAKLAEKYAKATNTACVFYFVYHQPKMPASLIKED